MENEGSLPHSQVPATCLYPESARSRSHFLKIHLNIILPSTPGSPMWSLSLWFPHQNSVYSSSFPHKYYMAHPFNFSWFDHPNNIWWGVQISQLLFFSFLHSSVTLSLLGPNILLNTLNLHTSLSVSNQVTHSNKTTGKIIVLYVLIFIFLDSTLGKHKILHQMIASIPWLQFVPINSWIEFWLICQDCSQIYELNLSKELLLIFMLWLHPAFWSWDMTMYLVLSAFTSSPISLLVATKTCVFVCNWYATGCILTLSA